MADQQNSKIRHKDHLLLDQSLLRLPTELLRKNFRSAHFVIEKDTSALKTLLKDSATAAVSGQASQQDVLRNIDTMLTKMRGVKRKLTTYADEEARLHKHMATRISHLDELYSMQTVEDVTYEAWSRKRLDRLLVDYLLRRGYIRSARALVSEKDMEELADVDTFVKVNRVRAALLEGSVTEALAWCTDNKKELRKMESKLEFNLRLQQYIELIRKLTEPKLIEAIAHAKKYLMSFWNTYPKEVQQACGLLAIPPNTRAAAEAYDHLYKLTRWGELADLYTTTHHKLLALPSMPLLHLALSSGLSALKTPACRLSIAGYAGMPSSLGHGVCPICSTELNGLARNVPYAHHTQSHVEHDLLLLPNGRVLGKQRLQDQARKAGLPSCAVKDPFTGDVYPAAVLKKVYIT